MPKLMCPAETLKTYSHAKLIVTFRYPYFPLGFVFFLAEMSQTMETWEALFQTATSASEIHSTFKLQIWDSLPRLIPSISMS